MNNILTKMFSFSNNKRNKTIVSIIYHIGTKIKNDINQDTQKVKLSYILGDKIIYKNLLQAK